jgi:hypothetical protein
MGVDEKIYHTKYTKALKNVSYTRTLREGNEVWIELESL